MQTRGTSMLGYSSYRYSSAIQIAIGSVLSALGVGMLMGPLFGGDPGMMAGALGPIIGGSVNIAVGVSMRRRYVSDSTAHVELTPEAKGLLMALHRRLFGWRSPWVWSTNPEWRGFGPSWRTGVPFGAHRMARRARRAAMWGGVTPEMVPETIDDDELQDLDQVAAQYNRTIGNLEASKAGSATLSKLAPRIAKAADEAMAEALHQAAMLMKFPEGGSIARAKLQQQQKALQELADRVETMAAGQSGIADQLPARSSIDDVLDELRLEQLARSELRSEPERKDVQARD